MAVAERYGFDPEERAAKSWLWRECQVEDAEKGKHLLERGIDGTVLEVMCRAPFVCHDPNLLYAVHAVADPAVVYAYWTQAKSDSDEALSP